MNPYQSFKERVRREVSIDSYINRFVPLRRMGRNLVGICPFHNEKTPSFNVNSEGGFYHCFGCKASGDLFRFVMDYQKVDFLKSLEILSDYSGIPLVERTKEEEESDRKKEALYQISQKALEYFQRNLNTSAGEVALKYLESRGMYSEDLKVFKIGFGLPGFGNLRQDLFKTEAEVKLGEQLGLLKRQDQNRDPYDFFRSRIMFPVIDTKARVIAFSGRILGESEEAKYINSPQTILYDKSRILYGFDKAKAEIRKKDTCVLVEGQMDVLMSHQAGVLNVAAISGIGLTVYHLDLIGRLADNLIVSFDSDEAGLVAAGRGIDLALGKGFEVKVVVLPFGKDPADVASKDYSAWKKAVEESRHIIDFYLQTLSEKIKEPRELKNKVEKIILPYVSLIESEIGKSHWIKEISKRLDIREESIWEQMKKIKLKEFSASETSDAGHFDVGNLKPRRLLLEERILSIAFWKNDVNIIPADKHFLFSPKQLDLLKKPETSNDSKNENKRCREKLSLEGELAYFGTEEDRLPKEIKILLTELEEEVLREERFAIMNEIKILEAKGEEEIINEKICKLNELNREITNLQKFKNEN